VFDIDVNYDDGPMYYDVSEMTSLFLKSSALVRCPFRMQAALSTNRTKRGVEISFNYVDFLGGTESWTKIPDE